MSVETQFANVSKRLFGDGGGVEEGRILHSAGLETTGKFFAFTRNGELVVKLPAARVAELIADGIGRPFEPRRGRQMREWIVLTPAEERACGAYVVEARDFVAGNGKAERL